MSDELVERVAKAICAERGFDPDCLEAGDEPVIDGYLRNGDPGHRLWREHVDEARAAIAAVAAYVEEKCCIVLSEGSPEAREKAYACALIADMLRAMIEMPTPIETGNTP